MHYLVRRAAYLIESFVTARLTQSWRRHRQFEERYVGRLLEELQVDCVLDVGANIGQYGRMLRENSGYRGLIVSFEPTPSVVDLLRRTRGKDPLWHIESLALANFTGKSTFRTLPASVGNSFLPLKENNQPDVQEIDVDVRRLSDVLPELQKKFGFKRPFLKMDTQGYDLEVFAGGREVMEDIVGLQSELSVDGFYSNVPDWLEALEIYKAAGFSLSTLVANHLEWFPRLREIDCLMFRERALSTGKQSGG